MHRRYTATLLVGASALLREGLTRILTHTSFRIVASVSRVHDITWASLPTSQPILLIIDARDGPDETVAQIRLFKEQRPSGRVAVVASHGRPVDMLSAFQAGANLYHVKLANFAAFTKALELVMLGETVLSPELLSFIGDRKDEGVPIPAVAERASVADKPARSAAGDMPELSNREKCILRCIVDGGSNKDIARRVGIATSGSSPSKSSFMRAPGDLVIAISSSGRSANILNAVKAARAAGCMVVTLSGFSADNPLRRLGDLNLHIGSDRYGFVEIGHLTICHAVLDFICGLRVAEGIAPAQAAAV